MTEQAANDAMLGQLETRLKAHFDYVRELVQRMAELETALWLEQLSRETKAEHYRQSDNGWIPSPGWEKVDYGMVCKVRDEAHRTRCKVLGIDPDFKPKVPLGQAPDIGIRGIRLSEKTREHYWIVQRRPMGGNG